MDIFWTFYLNHLSPLWGYFCLISSSLKISNLFLFSGIFGIYVSWCLRATCPQLVFLWFALSAYLYLLPPLPAPMYYCLQVVKHFSFSALLYIHQIHQPLLKFLLFLFDILFDIPTIHTSNINDTQISFDIYTSIHHLNLISILILFVLL